MINLCITIDVTANAINELRSTLIHNIFDNTVCTCSADSQFYYIKFVPSKNKKIEKCVCRYLNGNYADNV